jgi:hypothetical protein
MSPEWTFDMLVEGNENGNWLGVRDSNPDRLREQTPVGNAVLRMRDRSRT